MLTEARLISCSISSAVKTTFSSSGLGLGCNGNISFSLFSMLQSFSSSGLLCCSFHFLRRIKGNVSPDRRKAALLPWQFVMEPTNSMQLGISRYYQKQVEERRIRRKQIRKLEFIVWHMVSLTSSILTPSKGKHK